MNPPRHRFALINWLAIYPLITLILWGLGPLLAGLPLPLETLILSAILVSLMNFAIMPLMTRLFRRWLHPARQLDSKLAPPSPSRLYTPPPEEALGA